MKRKLLLSFFVLSISFHSFAQDNKAYAITGNGNGDFLWMNIRQIDLSTGSATKNIFENGKTKFTLVNDVSISSKIAVTNSAEINKFIPANSPTSMVAAAAYDKKHDKLFFTPMFIGELRWVDLSSNTEAPTFHTLQSPALHFGDPNDEANHFTRMTIGADGNGYALTNDGNHLIKFTTGKKVVITDIGALVDASSNDHISVHNKCSSWGGDMVADAFGNLYLFTASKSVFKINVTNMTATYVGSVTGLSGSYTLNGAAVADDNSVMISSANTFEGFYKVNMKDLSASKLNTTGQIFNASDLANGNLLFAAEARNTLGSANLIQKEIMGNRFISIYPNPVVNSQFKVTFDKQPAGQYTIALTDVQGKILINKQVYITSPGQTETIQMQSKAANGMYLIKVTDINKRSVFADKIVLE